jgi:hypothetical protein
MTSPIAFRGIVAALGCWAAASNASEPIVFIVSHLNLDYAKAACEHVLSMEPDAAKAILDETVAAAIECRTVRDPRELGRRLENDVVEALAVEPLCFHVTVVKDPDRNYDAGSSAASRANLAVRQKNPFWDLHLDYRPGSKVFEWHLFPNDAGLKSSGPLVSGEGTKAEAANQICVVASGRAAIGKD